VENSIVQGYSPTTYGPTGLVTRDEMAVFIARSIVTPTGEAGLADYEPTLTPSFLDIPADFWSYRHIEYVAAEGVAGGYYDGLYHPENPVDRAQMAVFICRAFDLPT